MKKLLLCAALGVGIAGQAAFADRSHSYHRADGHAPIGVMGDHTHIKGEFMLSYRYMEMGMDDLYQGDSKVAPADLKGQFMMVPTEMTMKMHMFGAMYAPIEKVTLMAMLPYIENEMDMVNVNTNAKSEMESDGVGDLTLSSLIKLDIGSSFATHLNLGLSIPTGAIDEAAANGTRLPYAMQLGSGTFDPKIGITGVRLRNNDSYGYQLNTVFRLGRNEEDYSRGEKYEATVWYARLLTDQISLSGRLTASHESTIDGIDDQIQKGNASPRFANNFGGTNFHSAIGVNYLFKNGVRIAAEYELPIYQNLKGTQLNKSEIFTLGIQKSF